MTIIPLCRHNLHLFYLSEVASDHLLLIYNYREITGKFSHLYHAHGKHFKEVTSSTYAYNSYAKTNINLENTTEQPSLCLK